MVQRPLMVNLTVFCVILYVSGGNVMLGDADGDGEIFVEVARIPGEVIDP